MEVYECLCTIDFSYPVEIPGRLIKEGAVYGPIILTSVIKCLERLITIVSDVVTLSNNFWSLSIYG